MTNQETTKYPAPSSICTSPSYPLGPKSIMNKQINILHFKNIVAKKKK